VYVQLPPTQMVHIGRQPVYDRDGEVYGYELLFRGAMDALSSSHASAYATSQVILNAFTEFGIGQLVGDRTCFINLTRDFLVGALAVPFEPGQAVLEVLETITVDDAVVAGVELLAARGYRIALDDFVWGTGHERLLTFASYVKLNIVGADPVLVAETVRRCRAYPDVRLVAERLESAADVAFARRLGFDFFQGYVLSRPQVLSAVSRSTSRLHRVSLLGALTGDRVDLDQVVANVTSDPALSFRVLQATNSASAGLSRNVSSVRDAVLLLGARRIRQWVALMIVADLAEARDDQLSTTMTRARLCQNLAERLGQSGESAFTVGLLAGVAELLDTPADELVSRLPLTADVAEALVSGRGPLGEVLTMVRAYEACDGELLEHAPVSSAELAREYLAALGWSVRTLDGVLGAGTRRGSTRRAPR
jgi:c-di-GMP-related signal transduction protein